MKRKDVPDAIDAAIQTDPNYAHALLHCLVGIYQHTPIDVRGKRLRRYQNRWPQLVEHCMRGCSQTRAALARAGA